MDYNVTTGNVVYKIVREGKQTEIKIETTGFP